MVALEEQEFIVVLGTKNQGICFLRREPATVF
jgi:hypothetical protein